MKKLLKLSMQLFIITTHQSFIQGINSLIYDRLQKSGINGGLLTYTISEAEVWGMFRLTVY